MNRTTSGFLCLLAAMAYAGMLSSCYECDDDDDHHHASGDHRHDDDDDYDCHDDDDHHHHHHTGGGHLVIVVTDSPDRELRSLYVTVTAVSVVTVEREEYFLYESAAGHRVDLLSLRGTRQDRLHDILVARTDVPAETYDAVRLTLRDPGIVLASGETVGPSRIDLAAAGNLEVYLDQPLPLGPTEVVHLVLDFDVERSVAGEGRRWRLRPLVLVEALREDEHDGIDTMVALAGKVVETDLDAGVLQLDLTDGRGFTEVSVEREDLLVVDSRETRLPVEAIECGGAVVLRGSLEPAGRLVARAITCAENLPAAVARARTVSARAAGDRPARRLPPRSFGGAITAIDAASREVIVANAFEVRSLRLPPDVPLRLLEEVGGTLTQRPILFGEVRTGMRVRADAEPSARSAPIILDTLEP